MANLTMKATKLVTIITHFFTTIFTWKMIITQITLTSILPLTFIFFPETQKNPHNVFKFTFNCSLYDPIMFTMLLFYQIPDNLNPRRNLKPMKHVLNLFLRLIVTFPFVYFLLILGDNLMVAVLGLSDVILVAIFAVWYVVLKVYHLGLLFLIYALQFATVRPMDLVEAQKGVREVMPKMSIGFLVNVLVMVPLIRNVSQELMPVWDLMIRFMILVLLLPSFLVHGYLLTKVG